MTEAHLAHINITLSRGVTRMFDQGLKPIFEVPFTKPAAGFGRQHIPALSFFPDWSPPSLLDRCNVTCSSCNARIRRLKQLDGDFGRGSHATLWLQQPFLSQSHARDVISLDLATCPEKLITRSAKRPCLVFVSLTKTFFETENDYVDTLIVLGKLSKISLLTCLSFWFFFLP